MCQIYVEFFDLNFSAKSACEMPSSTIQLTNSCRAVLVSRAIALQLALQQQEST
jgi:hypothetical protein